MGLCTAEHVSKCLSCPLFPGGLQLPQQVPQCLSVPQLGLQHLTAGSGTGLHTHGDPISILLHILLFHSTQTLPTKGSYLQMGRN